MKRPLIIIALFLVIAFTGYALVRKAYVFRSTYEPTALQAAELRRLGGEAISTGDVPVAALLVYKDSIIGRGCNTVVRNGDAAGHAEVNAVSDALRTRGRDGLSALDRENLLLVSTFEPCAMCSGMLLEYRIERVAFEETKSLWHWMRHDARWVANALRNQRSGPDGLQDSLFRAHPAYDPTTADH